MKTIVIYKSRTGHTKQYAEMIAQTLECEAISLADIKNINIDSYDSIIFGGSVRASKIGGLNSFVKHVDKSKAQKIFIYAVGANPISDKNTKELIDKNLIDKNLDYTFYYLQGGFDPDKLNFALRKMLNGVAKSINKKKLKDPSSLSQEDNDFLEFFQSKQSYVSELNIEELVKELLHK